ncbi:MAG: AAA family ATPase [Desulfuromonadaceae bacterium]
MNPFGLGVAARDRFCNRVAEIGLLSRNMLSGIHTVVYAPRRYGKSSLARRVLAELEPGMTGVYVDLFSITTADDAAEKMYRSIVNALGRHAADKNSLGSRITTFFKRLRVSLEFDQASGTPEFSVSLGDVAAEIHLESVIANLDDYCADNRIKVCLVLDEFQEICNLKESKKIEALLRSGMQVAQHVTFMMLGSRRTILRDMFEDRKRPFYKSSYVMKLQPMPRDEFADYLVRQFAAGELLLPREEADQIVAFTEAYPYYTQKLAMLYYDMKRPGASIAEAQQFLVEMESADCENIFVGLTNHQKRFLRAIATAHPANIFAAAFLAAHRLGSQGGVQSSLAKLKKLDLVEQDEIGWRVTDPILCKWLVK